MHQPILPPKSDPPQAVLIPKTEPPPRLDLLMQDIEDDEPTLRMQVPPHLLWSCRPESPKHRGPNYGMIGAILFCLAFWGSLAYYIWG